MPIKAQTELKPQRTTASFIVLIPLCFLCTEYDCSLTHICLLHLLRATSHKEKENTNPTINQKNSSPHKIFTSHVTVYHSLYHHPVGRWKRSINSLVYQSRNPTYTTNPPPLVALQSATRREACLVVLLVIFCFTVFLGVLEGERKGEERRAWIGLRFSCSSLFDFLICYSPC